MRSSKIRPAPFLFAIALWWGTGPGVQGATEFVKLWSVTGCTNVLSAERDLWDDSPGAGVTNESGFMWVVLTSTLNEKCTWGADGEGIDTGTFPDLRVRAAVNDGAIFTVEVRAGSEFCAGGVSLGSVVISGADDHSGFLTRTAALADDSASEVCVTLDDDPNTATAGRASALIDEIRIWDSRSGSIAWREHFTNIP